MKIPVGILFVFILALSACKETKRIVGEPMVGTPIRLQIPAGFYRESDQNTFFHKEYDANIIVNSYPVSYETAVAQYSKEQFEKAEGRKLISSEQVEINGVKGLLCQAGLNKEGYNFKRWQLVLPEGSGTLTVFGTFMIEQEKELSEPMRNMLLHAYLDTDWKPDMSQLDFTVEPAGELKLAKMLDGPSVMYTADGEWVNSSVRACSFLCGSNAGGRVENPVEYTEKTFLQICPHCEIAGQDSLTVNGLRGREIWGTEKDSLATRLKYEAVVFDSLQCYYFIGTVEKDSESWLKQFRSSVRTLKKKVKSQAI
jgi:hypothetical protein